MSELQTPFAQRARELDERIHAWPDWGRMRSPFDAPEWLGFLLSSLALASLPDPLEFVHVGVKRRDTGDLYDCIITVVTERRIVQVGLDSSRGGSKVPFEAVVHPRSSVRSARLSSRGSSADQYGASEPSGYPANLVLELRDRSIALDLPMPHPGANREPANAVERLLASFG